MQPLNYQAFGCGTLISQCGNSSKMIPSVLFGPVVTIERNGSQRLPALCCALGCWCMQGWLTFNENWAPKLGERDLRLPTSRLATKNNRDRVVAGAAIAINIEIERLVPRCLERAQRVWGHSMCPDKVFHDLLYLVVVKEVLVWVVMETHLHDPSHSRARPKGRVPNFRSPGSLPGCGLGFGCSSRGRACANIER